MIIVVDNGSKHTKKVLDLLSDQDVKLVEPGRLNSTEITGHELVILSGSRRVPVLWHNRHYKNELELIRRHRGPIIGICLGFELIAHAFGRPLHLLSRRIKGKRTIHATEAGLMYFDGKQQIDVYEAHRFAIRKLGREFEVLAQSRAGVEFARHVSRPIFGMQFHPENSGIAGHEIFVRLIYTLNNSVKN